MASLLDSLTTRSFFSIPSISRIASPLSSSSSFVYSSSSINPSSILSYSHQHSHSRFSFPVNATLDGSFSEEEVDFEEFEEVSDDNYVDDSDEDDVPLDISILEKEARDIVRDYATTLSRELKLEDEERKQSLKKKKKKVENMIINANHNHSLALPQIILMQQSL